MQQLIAERFPWLSEAVAETSLSQSAAAAAVGRKNVFVILLRASLGPVSLLSAELCRKN